MRTVLYAHDMEPITILELSDWMQRFLEKHGRVDLPVATPVPVRARSADDILPALCGVRRVCITAEIFMRRGERTMMLFTHNEENAMLLRAAFLPGQRSALKDFEREAFAKGFLAAWEAFG